MPNIRAGKKASIGGIDGSQTAISTLQVCDIPCVGVGFLNENAVANIISWSKCIKLGMDPDYNREYQSFVLYGCDTSGWIFAVDREGLYECYTKGMSPVELPSHFMRLHNVGTLSTVAQNMAKYTNREVQAVKLAKQFRERVGLMSSRDAYVIIHHV